LAYRYRLCKKSRSSRALETDSETEWRMVGYVRASMTAASGHNRTNAVGLSYYHISLVSA